MLVLDKVLGLELSIFNRQLKMQQKNDDDHQMIVEMFSELVSDGRMEFHEEEKPKRQNAK